MGGILGDEDRIISFGKYEEGVQWYERSLEYGRIAVRMDPQENQARSNAAVAAWHLGNILRHTDAVRAFAAYDEAVTLLRGMQTKMVIRDLPLAFVLGESTFPLRRVHRDGEARKRLDEAKQIAAGYKNITRESPDMPPEAITRAEADWALALGRPLEAAAIHLQWLQDVGSGDRFVKKSLRDALLVARQYQLLGHAYQLARQPQQEADALARRDDILEFWRNKPGSRKFVGGLLSISAPSGSGVHF